MGFKTKAVASKTNKRITIIFFFRSVHCGLIEDLFVNWKFEANRRNRVPINTALGVHLAITSDLYSTRNAPIFYSSAKFLIFSISLNGYNSIRLKKSFIFYVLVHERVFITLLYRPPRQCHFIVRTLERSKYSVTRAPYEFIRVIPTSTPANDDDVHFANTSSAASRARFVAHNT